MRFVHSAVVVFGLGLSLGGLNGAELEPAWGVDAGVSWAVAAEAVPEWLALLKTSEVRVLRERGVWGAEVGGLMGTETAGGARRTVVGEISADIRARYTAMHAAGFSIVAFAGQPPSVHPERVGNELPEDLSVVFASGFKQGYELAGLVSAWEITGEPDVGYCRDLPDRLAAYNKAMYLGLHAGARAAVRAGGGQLGAHDPVVLMGALALHPGPWWERAVANGLLDYTDAYNFHFYGYAGDLTSVIEAHRSALRELGVGSGGLAALGSKRLSLTPRRAAERGLFGGAELTAKNSQRQASSSKFRALSSSLASGPRTLPLWITECGVNAAAAGDFFNAERRAYQAQFTVETAQQAWDATDVAVFMPFILVHKGDPHALVVADNVSPLPAWDAYAQFTKNHPWPKRTLFESAGKRASPVVLQWMPAAGTLSHKVAGCYRVRDGESITGEMRVYNFSEQEVRGRWAVGAGSLKLGAGSSNQGVPITIPAGGWVAVPASYSPKMATGYFREWQTVRFREESGRESPVFFGVERVPAELDLALTPLRLQRLDGGGRLQAPAVNVEGLGQGPWRVFNGLEVNEREAGSLALGARSDELPAQSSSQWRFTMGTANNDPMAPSYATAALTGVPKGAQFLRVKLDRPMSNDAFVRGDLVDTDGQRFTIWENVGNSYGAMSREVWLGLADFHPYFWSKAVPGERHLRPEKVCELQLRMYLPKGGAMDVGLDWATAKQR